MTGPYRPNDPILITWRDHDGRIHHKYTTWKKRPAIIAWVYRRFYLPRCIKIRNLRLNPEAHQ